MAETTSAALVPLVATLGSFVAKGTGYALGTFVTALGAFVADKAAAWLGSFVGEHARTRAVPLVPARGRHFFLLLHRFFASLGFLPTKILELRIHRPHFSPSASVLACNKHHNLDLDAALFKLNLRSPISRDSSLSIPTSLVLNSKKQRIDSISRFLQGVLNL